MSDLYKTIRATSEGYYTEKRSRFLSFAIPVRTPEEAKLQVEACRKKYYDARHVCWAYMLGADRTTFRSNDDGEPSSTAGKPILGQINSKGLTDILVIVVRYFGGIKLGAGGLIRAYAGSVALAIKEIGSVHIKEQLGLRLTFSYSQYQELPNFLKAKQLQEQDTAFTDQVQTTIFVDKDDKDSVIESLIELFNGKIDIVEQGLRKVEVPISLS